MATDERTADVKERMVADRYPRQIVIIDELPTTVTGEIRRRDLRR